MINDIEKLLTSIIEEKETLTKSYIFAGEINSENFEKLKKILQKFLNDDLIKPTSSIVIGTNPIQYLNKINDLHCNVVQNIKVTLIKKNLFNKLIIFSLDSIKKNLEENLFLTSTSLSIINSFFKEETIILEDSNKIIKYVNNEKILPTYLNEFTKIIKFKTADTLSITPHNIDMEKINIINVDINKKFHNIVNSLKNYISLIYISSSIDIIESDKEIKVLFDGNKEKKLSIKPEDIFDNFNQLDKLKEIFFWVYKKEGNNEKNQNFIEKLEIIRNLISISFYEEDTLNKLEDKDFDILKKSRSSYTIYLKSKTKDYFELRFKVEEHIDKLFNNLSDELSKFTDFFRSNLYIFIGLLFSSVVVFILRSEVRNLNTNTNILVHNNILLNENLSGIIILYGIFSLFVLFFSVGKFYSNTFDINRKFLGLKKQYKNFLDSDDLDTIIGDSFEKRKKKNYKWAAGISIIWIIVSFSLIFNSSITKKIYKDSNDSDKSNPTNIEKNRKLLNSFTIYYDKSVMDITKLLTSSNKLIQEQEILRLNKFINNLSTFNNYYIVITSNASKEKITKSNTFSNNYQLTQARANSSKLYIIEKLLANNFPINNIKFYSINRSNIDALNNNHDNARLTKIEFYTIKG